MPCTWTRYGEPPPQMPINTGGKTKNREEGGRFLGKKKDKKRDEEFFGEKREASYKKKTKESESRRGEGKIETTVSAYRRRRTVLIPWEPPLFLPLHGHQQHREQPLAEPGGERVKDWSWREKKWKKNRIQGTEK